MATIHTNARGEATAYLTCAETAKRLRLALTTTFPGVRFSVRSHRYAGGASIDVRWVDGPASAEVQRVGNRFEGATFDAMTDCKDYKTALSEGGQRVQYGADFVCCQRYTAAEWAAIR